MFHELHSRTILKALTWFVTGFLISFLVLIIFTHDWQLSIIDAVIIQVIKILFYYLHERAWNRSNFGQRLKISETSSQQDKQGKK